MLWPQWAQYERGEWAFWSGSPCLWLYFGNFIQCHFNMKIVYCRHNGHWWMKTKLLQSAISVADDESAIVCQQFSFEKSMLVFPNIPYSIWFVFLSLVCVCMHVCVPACVRACLRRCMCLCVYVCVCCYTMPHVCLLIVISPQQFRIVAQDTS